MKKSIHLLHALMLGNMVIFIINPLILKWKEIMICYFNKEINGTKMEWIDGLVGKIMNEQLIEIS
jgi:hypothetical protein